MRFVPDRLSLYLYTKYFKYFTETAQTENEYEQIEVSISYVRLVPAFFCLILYFYTEYTSNTLPETAQPGNEYEQIEVNISVQFFPTS